MKLCVFYLLHLFILIGLSDERRRIVQRRKRHQLSPESEEYLNKNVIVVHAPKQVALNNSGVRFPLNETILESSSSLLDEDDDSMEDPGDSDVSEERNEDDLINGQLSAVHIDADQRRPDDVISVISSAFNNRKTFSCPKIKSDFKTGTSTANLSPEDISIIAAMGDSLATGAGLWPRTDIEFRGAAFPIGGDATIDGLVTIPNILREFSEQGELTGVSHGMGSRDQLPENQLNVAMSGASSSSMPQQAKELVRRIRSQNVDVYRKWTMVIITIGTEEICSSCSAPNTAALKEALEILNRGIHRAFVILLGPIHVSSSYDQKANLLKDRCECSRLKAKEFLEDLSKRWADAFEEIQEHVTPRKTFNLLALPMLTITSRYPYSLFIPHKPLLNRRGHTYATKFLWNRLIAGPKYNLSKAILSQDAYFCPSLGCPYFRTIENYNYCKIISHADAKAIENAEAEKTAYRKGARRKFDLYVTALVIVSLASVAALALGTVFYQRSKNGTKGRYDQTPYNADILRGVRDVSMRRKTGVDPEKEALNESVADDSAAHSNGSDSPSS